MVKYENVAGDLDEPGRRPPVEEPPEIQRHLPRRLAGGRWAARGAEFKKKKLRAAGPPNHPAGGGRVGRAGARAGGREGMGGGGVWCGGGDDVGGQ